MKWHLTYITVFLFSSLSFGQPRLKQYIEKGREALQELNFSGAMEYLYEALDRNPDNVEVWHMYAEASRQQYAFAEAERAYQIVVDSMDNNQYPEATFYLAEMKMLKGDYESALTYYDIYLSENEGDDELLTERAQLQKESAEWAQEHLRQPRDSVNITHLDALVNTEYSEHAALQVEEQLFFTSLRFPKEKDDYEVNRYVSKVLVHRDSLQSEVLDESGMFNSSEVFTSSSVFSADGTMMFYSICDYEDDGRIKCDIYYKKIDTTGVWGPDMKIGSEVNDTASTATQPALQEHSDSTFTLYFVTNRPGGKGGLDIWKSDFDSEMQFTDPDNLEEINTKWDDITPFYHGPEEKLYFSSDGRPEALGGFDIYATWVAPDGDRIIENIGYPINTSYHEIFYSRSGEESHFSSNKPGSFYLDDKFETCCYDIYRVEHEMCEIKFLTFDSLTREPLNGVKLIVKFENEDWQVIDSLEQLDSHEFKFLVECDVRLELEATRPGYQPLRFDTSGIGPFFVKELYLQRQPIELTVHTFEEGTRLPLDGVRVRLQDPNRNFEVIEEKYDPNMHGYSFEVIPGLDYRITGTKDGYDGAELDLSIPSDQLDDMDAELYLRRNDLGLHVLTFERGNEEPLKGVRLKLENLTDTQIPEIERLQPDTNLFVFSINNQHEYRITAEKDGYEVEILEFEAIYTGEDTITKKIYLGRIPEIETLAKLLPLNLYYDNDQPNPNSRDTTTKENYTTTYHFYQQKQNEFAQQYSNARPETARPESRNEINQFFREDLKGGHDSLSIFLETLERVLERGKTVNLYFRGYASPLHEPDYNRALGKRRIEAFKNEFLFYKDGLFREYIDTGQLILTERSFGESTAPSGISDDPDNPGLSIYSPEASRERRIEIDEITEIKN